MNLKVGHFYFNHDLLPPNQAVEITEILNGLKGPILVRGRVWSFSSDTMPVLASERATFFLYNRTAWTEVDIEDLCTPNLRGAEWRA